MSNNIVLADGAGNIRYQWNGTNNVFGNPISGTSATFSSSVTAANLRIGNGSVSTPSYSFTNSTNTGFYLTDDGFGPYVNLAMSGSNAVTIKYNGNVGIGTSSPNRLLILGSAFGATAGLSANVKLAAFDNGISGDIYGLGISSGMLEIQSAENIGFYNGTGTTRTERMRITSGGGINTYGPYLSMDGAGLTSPPAGLGYGLFPHSGVGLGISSVAVGISFWVGSTPTEKMRITSGGDVGIGNTGFASTRLTTTGKDNSSSNYSFVANNSSNSNLFLVRNDGAVIVSGSLSKGSGSFRIDHPLESMTETHQLVHSFVEAPQADLYYRGKLTLVNGKGQANIDEVATMTEGTFEALCREVQCFTTNETGWDLVKGKVIGNIIYIESQNQDSIDEISWLVIGERQDKHMMDTAWTDDNGRVIVEPLKEIEKL
jgi:hypothetical protein